MVGTAMFINSLNELLYNVGAVYILSYTVSILMFCVGIRLLARAEGDITNGRRRVI